MKISTISTIIFSILFITLLSSCKEDDSEPMSTQNSFSVKIDGELFNAGYVITGIVGEEQQLFSFATFSMSAFKSIGSFENMIILFSLPFDQMVEATSYSEMGDGCDDPSMALCSSITYSGGAIDEKSGVSNVPGGSSNITFSSIEYLPGGHATGTFSGEIVDPNTTEIITLTEGKFDLKINL